MCIRDRAKETEEYTWLDSYFSVMLTFQFLSFVLVVVSSRWERYVEDGGALKLQTLRRTRTTRSLELSPAYRRVFWLHRHFFGGADVPPVDLAVRRGLVPLFLLLQMGLCYYPFRGPGAIVGHRDAPLGGSLFFLNVGCLLWYAAVWKSNIQPDFNVRAIERIAPESSAVLRELDESNRFVQKSAESTSI